MNRRSFVKQLGIVSIPALIAPGCLEPSASPPRYRMGYQLYSIRDEMAKSPLDTLKALQAMGYQDFELYGFDDQKGSFYGYEASEFKRILDDMNLTVTSGHYGFAPYLDKSVDELRQYVDRCIGGAQKLDSKYITWPFVDPEQRNRDGFKRLAQRLNIIGEQVRAAGLGFAYHNHGYEFEDYDGEKGFDIIVNETDADLVKLEMDMYWVMHSAQRTPKELVDAQPGRYVLWHIKDMDKVSRDYTELGNGSINYHEVLPDPAQSGLEYFYIEQGGNFTHNSTESAAASARYFQENLQQYL